MLWPPVDQPVSHCLLLPLADWTTSPRTVPGVPGRGRNSLRMDGDWWPGKAEWQRDTAGEGNSWPSPLFCDTAQHGLGLEN